MSLNFKRFDQKDKAFWTLIIAFIATALLMWAIFQVPDQVMEKVPNYLLPLIYTPIIAFYADKMQKQDIQKLEEQEGVKEHWGKALGIGVLGAILTFAVVFQLAISEPLFEGEKFVYGKARHEIYYQGNTINEELLNKVGHQLEMVGYFTDEFAQAAHVQEGENRYIFSIYIDESYWEDEEVLDDLEWLKLNLELNLSKEITIKMLHATWTDVKEKRI